MSRLAYRLQHGTRGDARDQIGRGRITVNATDRPVCGPDGIYGVVDTTCWPSLDERPHDHVHVRLPDGKHRAIPADALIEQSDGSFYVPFKREELEQCPEPQIAPGTEGEDHWPCPRQEGPRKT